MSNQAVVNQVSGPNPYDSANKPGSSTAPANGESALAQAPVIGPAGPALEQGYKGVSAMVQAVGPALAPGSGLVPVTNASAAQEAAGPQADPQLSDGTSLIKQLGMTPEQMKDPKARLSAEQKTALMGELNLRPEEFSITFDRMFTNKSPQQVATALDSLHVHDPSKGPEAIVNYAKGGDDAKAVDKKLAPEGERKINDKRVYGSDGRLMGEDDIAGKVNQWVGKGYNLNERVFAGYGMYLDKLDQQETSMQGRYQHELDNEGKIFGGSDDDLMLLLGQQLKDIRAAKDGSGYHALTAEEEILNNYITRGTEYTDSKKPDIPGQVGKDQAGRPNKPPDNNLVMFTSGFDSGLEKATQDAYSQAYKMGYPLDKIYVFNYTSDQPVLLSDCVNEKGKFIEKKLDSSGKEQVVEVGNLEFKPGARGNLLQHNPNAWTAQQNKDSNFDDKIVSMQKQLHAIQASNQGNPEQKINMIGNSQGGGLTAGFLLQKDKEGKPLMDPTLDQFIGNVALTVPASGGSFFSESSKDGLAANTVGQIPQSNASRQLRISSDFEQRNYAAMEDPAVRARVGKHNLTEVYAANDTIVSSVPLLSLAGPQNTFMVDGEHSDVHERASNYLYNSWYNAENPDSDNKLQSNLESDRLKYKGYLNKGNVDFNWSTGKAGMVDPDVRNQYYKDMGKSDRAEVPRYFPVQQNPFFSTGLHQSPPPNSGPAAVPRNQTAPQSSSRGVSALHMWSS